MTYRDIDCECVVAYNLLESGKTPLDRLHSGDVRREACGSNMSEPERDVEFATRFIKVFSSVC